MAFEFKLPELGENIEQADIVKVMVSVGDKVEVDQILLEIETDKATVEVPAEKSGVVKSVNVKEGDTSNVGDIIFSFDEIGESDKAIDEKEESEPEVDKNVESIPEPEEEPKEMVVPKNESGGIIEFNLPELGENIETADITKILVAEGDKVEVDQILLEIETDKATVEVPAEFSGVVKEVKFKEGDTAKVGDIIFVIETGGSSKISSSKKTAAGKTESAKKEASITETITKVDTVDSPQIQKTDKKPVKSQVAKVSLPTEIAPAAPSVRRFAREIGIDINEVRGFGPGGRISVEDVKRYSKSINENLRTGGGGMPIGIKRESLPDFSKWGSIRKESMSNVRRKTAEHLSYAWATIPHVTQFDKADITELEILRKKVFT